MNPILTYNIFKGAELGDVQVINAYLVIGVQYGAIKDVKAIVSASHCGVTPLLIACRNGHLSVVQYLTQNCKADVEQIGNISIDRNQFTGISPLWCAAAAGQFHVVKLLVSFDADVNIATEHHSTPLWGACFDGHLEIVEYLVKKGSDTELVDYQGRSCLMTACARGHLAVVRYLLNCGTDVNKKSQKGTTALHDAAIADNVEIVKLLLDHGAVIERDSSGVTPMLAAALNARKQVVEYFVSTEIFPLEERIAAVELLGATFLDKEEDLRSALFYWRMGFNLRGTGSEEFIPKAVCSSALNYHIDVHEAQTLTELNELSANMDAIKLHSLLLRERILGPSHPDTVYYIRLRGALYADDGDSYYSVKLWLYAIDNLLYTYEFCDLVTFRIFTLVLDLCKVRLKSDEETQSKVPVFDFQTWMDIFDRALTEIEYGIKQISQMDEERINLLHRIIFTVLNIISQFTKQLRYFSAEQIQRFRMFLRKLVQVNPTLFERKTLLHMACRRTVFDMLEHTSEFPNHKVVDFLIEAGASTNAFDTEYNTPLHEAARSLSENQATLFRTLLENGAHYDFRNRLGKTPVELVSCPGALEICPLNYTTLQCLCSRAIAKNKIKYDVLPKRLKAFVERH